MDKFKQFLAEKGITQDEFDKKTPAEIGQLHSEYNSKQFKELRDEMAKAATPEQIKAVSDKLGEFEKSIAETSKGYASKEDVTKLVSDLKDANAEIKAIRDGGKDSKPQSFHSAIKEALSENHDALKQFLAGNKNGIGSFSIEVKAPAVTTSANVNPSGTATGAFAAQSVSSVSEYARNEIFVEQYLDTGETDKETVPYVDEQPGEGDATIVAEGALKPLIDVDYVTSFSQARKVAGAMKATKEALNDYGWLQSAMEKTLRRKHDIARQNDVIGATNGLLSIATVFNPTILGGVKVTAPQYYDAIAALVAGIANSSEGAYTPNVIFVNTLDNLQKMLSKDANNNYIMPPFADANGNIIEGVRIVAKPSLAAGDFIIGDFKNVVLRNLEGYNVSFGWENDDFRRNQITMLGESRYHLYATTNDRRGIIKGSFADVITALTAI